MERSGTNDFKDDRHPEKYLRVFYCGYHRRGKIVFYKKVSERVTGHGVNSNYVEESGYVSTENSCNEKP